MGGGGRQQRGPFYNPVRGAHYSQGDAWIKQFRHFARTWGDWIPAPLKAC